MFVCVYLSIENGAIASATTSYGVETGTGIPLVTNVVYTIEIAYSDIAGNRIISVVSPYTFDITPPRAPLLINPQPFGVSSAPFLVTYRIYEKVAKATLTFTAHDDALDPSSPHILTILSSNQLSIGQHSFVLPYILSDGITMGTLTSVNNGAYDTLASGAIYDITLNVFDIAGNAADDATNLDFSFGTSLAQPSLCHSLVSYCSPLLSQHTQLYRHDNPTKSRAIITVIIVMDI
jgi:hypothetical protein